MTNEQWMQLERERSVHLSAAVDRLLKLADAAEREDNWPTADAYREQAMNMRRGWMGW